VASVANLLAVGSAPVALAIHDHDLDRQLQTAGLSESVRQAIEIARGAFVVELALSGIQGSDRQVAGTIVKGSLAEGIQFVMLIAAGLALAGAAAGAVIPRSREHND